MQKKQTVFEATYCIVSGIIGGMLVAAIISTQFAVGDPRKLLVAGLVLGSIAGLLASMRHKEYEQECPHGE